MSRRRKKRGTSLRTLRRKGVPFVGFSPSTSPKGKTAFVTTFVTVALVLPLVFIGIAGYGLYRLVKD